jgi:purine-binding chemotaxis protein CheW
MSSVRSNLELPEHVIEFQLNNNRCCVALPEIAEIVEPKEITSVPSAPTHVSGVMDLRGQTAVIINPKLAIDVSETTSGKYAIIFDTATTGGKQIGWLVDCVHGVNKLSDPDIEPVDDSQHITAILQGRQEQFTLWVNSTSINSEVSDTEFSQLERGEE